MKDTRYRKIHTCLWSDRKFNELTAPAPNARYLWMYLLTGPHNTTLPGLFALGERTLADVLGWDFDEVFREAFGELLEKGMIKVDSKARLIWLPNAVRYNPPQSPNVVRSWKNVIHELPECLLKTEALLAIRDFVKGFGKAFIKALNEALPKDFVESVAVAVAVAVVEEESNKLSSSSDCFAPSHGDGAQPKPQQQKNEIGILLKGKNAEMFYPTEKQIIEFQNLYPGVDVPRQLQRMRAWSIAHPDRRKTARGVMAFITTWLDKEQNDPRGNHRQQNERPKSLTFDEIDKLSPEELIRYAEERGIGGA